MVRKLIIIGEVNKKYLLPFLLAIITLVLNMFIRYFPGNKDNVVLDLYSTSLGYLSVIFIPYIFKFTNTNTNHPKIKNIQKKKCLHYFFLVLIFIIYSVMKAVVKNTREDLSKDSSKIANYFTQGPFLYLGIEIIFLTIVSIIVIKYKYYIHHYISLAAFIILGAVCDAVLDNYSEIINYSFFTILMQFVSIFLDVINYYYQKYMMEVLYYPYWRISFTLGIILFFSATLFLIFVLIYKDKADSNTAFVTEFYLYFEEVHPGLIIGKQLLNMVIYFIYSSLLILNIYYFNPNFILISFQLPKFVDIVIDQKKEKYYFLVFFVLQFISLLIYLEIIELNFCKLNANTKRNIELRGIKELSMVNERESINTGSEIDIDGDYYINNIENEKESENTEMLSKKDEN